jgi:serine/threonine protein kinase
LKCFTVKSSEREKKFEREKKVLEKLKTFQQAPGVIWHIVTHYAAWSQRDDFFILFPLATGNLAYFMNYLPCQRVHEEPEFELRFDRHCMPYDKKTKLPILNKRFVLWLFTQLKGLADALDYIHHLEGDDEDDTNNKLPVPESETRKPGTYGYHHDIKPDNILVFVEDRIGYGTMKFGDFGSANFVKTDDIWKQTPVYTNKQRGTETYASPDFFTNGKYTSKADVWTLGCVFLDILIWCLEPRYPRKDNKDFADEREDEQSNPDNPTRVDKYWTHDPKSVTKKAVLKQAVLDKFEHIEMQCKAPNMLAFRQLHGLTKSMLKTNSASRIKTARLKTELAYLLQNVTANLNLKNENFYCGEIDSETVENLVRFNVSPPSPSTDAGRGRISDVDLLDLGRPQRPVTPNINSIGHDLQQVGGPTASTVVGDAHDKDILSDTEPGSQHLRQFAPVEFGPPGTPRSSSRQRDGVPFRRSFSDPTSTNTVNGI